MSASYESSQSVRAGAEVLLPLKRPRSAFSCRYNQARPHRGLGLQSPIGSQWPTAGNLMAADVRRRDVLGGLVHEYSIAA